MAVAQASLYQSMFQKLFPHGDYWDAQFTDPQSDLSRLCAVKSGEFTRLKERMTALQNESTVEKTEELIAEWERVLLGYVSVGLTLEQRRLLLKSKYDVRLNKFELQKVADIYGLTITAITFPYRPGFFGFSRFGRDRMAIPAAFSFLRITSTHPNFNTTWWGELKAEYPRKSFGLLRFGADRAAYFPASSVKKAVWKALRRSGFGFARFGIDRFLPVPLGEIRALVSERLRPYRFGGIRFGRDRMAFFLTAFRGRQVPQWGF